MIATETTMTPKETAIADKLLIGIEDSSDEFLMHAIEAYHRFLEAASIRRSMDRRLPVIPSNTATWGGINDHLTMVGSPISVQAAYNNSDPVTVFTGVVESVKP